MGGVDAGRSGSRCEELHSTGSSECQGWRAVPSAGLTPALGLAEAGCGGNAGLTCGLTDGLFAGGRGSGGTAALTAGWAGSFAPVPVAAKAVGGLAVAIAKLRKGLSRLQLRKVAITA